MRHRSSTLIAIFLAVFAMMTAIGVAQTPTVSPEAQVLAEFSARVGAYIALREKVDGDAPKMQQTADATKLKAAQVQLAALIRNARATARQGDIFTPPIETKFRALLRPEMKGAEGAKVKAEILDEKPAVALKVNADYPSTEPLSTVPTAILQALPRLPDGKGLEYRFVGRDLLLYDSATNLIVDYIHEALPSR